MPVVRHRSEMTTRQEAGWTETVCAGPAAFGAPVEMQARLFTLDPAAAMPPVLIAAQEAMVYVAEGSGTAQVGAERYPLERESMLWLSPATEIVLTAGPDGLECMLAQSAGA
jgi:redox-sensitive bicupin YhaK (pirin superfamily)